MMNRMLCILCLALSLTAAGQSPATEKHTREFLEASGSARIGMQVMHTMVESFKKELPSVPAEFWDEFMKEVNPDDLVNLIVPIYMSYFSDQEIQQLTAFYRSPVGLKLTEKMPLITQDSYAAGEKWGREIGERAAARLKEKGYLQRE